jgi:PAS domain S-box-containing protein
MLVNPANAVVTPEHRRQRLKVGAVCGKAARPDLCGGREITRVPTATGLAGLHVRCCSMKRAVDSRHASRATTERYVEECDMLQNLRVQAQADPTRRLMHSIWLAVVVGCVYTLAAQMSLALLTPDGVAVFWPAAGVAAGTLIAFGPNARWSVAVGTMVATVVANLLGDRNLLSSAVFALCNAGEALLVAGLIERYFGGPFSLDRLRHVLGLLGAAIIATAISGIGGTLGFTFFHHTTAPVFVTWYNWFASDALGIVTIAPLVIGLASLSRELPPRSETIEGLVALALLIVMSVIVIALPQQPWTTVVPIGLLFPVLLWIAARCRPVFAAAAVFIVTLAIVVTTTIGIGHFGDPGVPMADRVLAARAGILAVALCAYVLAALFAERRQHEAALAESEARLQEALTAGAVTTFVWDAGTSSPQRSANAAQILGFDPRQSLSSSGFLARVPPDDRDRFKALVRGVKPECPAYTATFRFKRRDGREVWLEETARAQFDAVGRLVRLKGLTLDVTARKLSEDQQTRLIATLDHRVKNLLARISALTKDMRQSSDSVDGYVEALGRRIQSMAHAHALLSQNRWDGVDLAELVRCQLAPIATDANAVIEGPKVTLTVATAQALAMVLHELATNAAKYGALSTPHGRVEVSWNRGAGKDAASLSIAWREIGGPAVAASPDCRYGVSVIRNLIPHELHGFVDLAFAPGGVCCKIQIPL